MTDKTAKLLSPGFKPAFLFLTLLILIPIAVFARSGLSLWGCITDLESGLPIENATVQIVPEGRIVRTDKDGRYQIYNLKYESVTIEVHAEAYESVRSEKVSLEAALSTRQDFALEKRVYYDPDQIVVAASDGEAAGKVVIADSSPEFRNARTVAEILEFMPQIIVSRAGGTNQTASLSIAGAPAKHTGIFIDGMPVNSRLTGEFDLNSIPKQAVKQIEIYTDGAGAEMGTGSLAGAVNIVTRKAEFEGEIGFEKSLGSFNFDETNMTIQNIFHQKLSGLFVFSRNTASNDFKYNDPKAGESMRQNNYRDLDSRFASLNYKINRHDNVYLTFSDVGSRAGLPGAMYSLTPTAGKSESFRTWNLGTELSPLKNVKLSASTQYYLSHQHFTDYDSFIPYDSKYRDSRLSFNLNPRYIFDPDHFLSARLSLNFDRFKQKYMLGHEQEPIEVGEDRMESNLTYNGRLGINDARLFFDFLNVKAAFSQTASELFRPLISPLARVDLEKGRSDKLMLHFSYSNSYRAPTYASLFWSEDAFSVGNPDLKPEKSEDFRTGLRFLFRCAGRWNLGLEYEHSYIKDLIYWERRFDGKYSPRNLSAARVAAVRWNAEWKSSNNLVNIAFSYSLSDPRDRSWEPNQHDNLLIFRPRKMSDLKLSLSPGTIFI
ncbi:MAG TPA: TonB-dependent receptor, partial [candidate division Zixibacteria bacterium]|nr:TonB-dependent receptor [candidate division Zixibacteria bacterium]